MIQLTQFIIDDFKDLGRGEMVYFRNSFLAFPGIRIFTSMHMNNSTPKG